MSDDVFRWVIAGAVILAWIAFLVQAGVVIALYRMMKKLNGRVMPLADKAEPIIDTTRKILEENRPRMAEISAEAAQVARNVRQQAIQISEVLNETTGRARARIEQIDRTVDETVEQVGHVGGAVKGAVLRPVREVNGIVAGLKAAITTYAQGGQRPTVAHATQDEEMFI